MSVRGSVSAETIYVYKNSQHQISLKGQYTELVTCIINNATWGGKKETEVYKSCKNMKAIPPRCVGNWRSEYRFKARHLSRYLYR